VRLQKFFLVTILAAFSLPSFASTVVLVTGASRGIGLSVVETLASDPQKRYKIYAGVRKTSNRAGLNELRSKYPFTIRPIILDVTDSASVKSAVRDVISSEGKIDCLVNNAGVEIYGSVENVTIEEAQNVFAVNFFGVMRVSQEVLPHMRKRSSGRIIQMSSRSGFRPYPSLGIYAASKFAMAGLSETMAAQLKPWNIHVSLIEPGPVNTSMDFLAPYGSRLTPEDDPYWNIFQRADALYPNPLNMNPNTQEPEVIAQFVKKAIEDEQPLFRYQTAQYIEKQARNRFVDISGKTQVRELETILYPDAAGQYHNQSLLRQ